MAGLSGDPPVRAGIIGFGWMHLWIEKPVGLTPDDARAVATAVAEARVVGVVGFNHRHAPALARARSLAERHRPTLGPHLMHAPGGRRRSCGVPRA